MKELTKENISEEEYIKMLESLPKNFLATQLVSAWKVLGTLDLIMSSFKKESE